MLTREAKLEDAVYLVELLAQMDYTWSLSAMQELDKVLIAKISY